MGGCASKPKDLDTEKVPTPVEAPETTPLKEEVVPAAAAAAPAPDKAEEETFLFFNVSFFCLHCSAAEAPKTEESTTVVESKSEIEEVIPAEVKPTEAVEEDKKEASETVVAPKSVYLVIGCPFRYLVSVAGQLFEHIESYCT